MINTILFFWGKRFENCVLLLFTKKNVENILLDFPLPRTGHNNPMKYGCRMARKVWLLLLLLLVMKNYYFVDFFVK
jgi:hypothetical protein